MIIESTAGRFPVISRLAGLIPGSAKPGIGSQAVEKYEIFLILLRRIDFYPVFPAQTGILLASPPQGEPMPGIL
jgi:hypothetical protein